MERRVVVSCTSNLQIDSSGIGMQIDSSGIGMVTTLCKIIVIGVIVERRGIVM